VHGNGAIRDANFLSSRLAQYYARQNRPSPSTAHLRGQEPIKVKFGEHIMSAPAQSVMFVPRGTPHAFQNVGTEPGVPLVGVTPGGVEKIFQERQGMDSATYGAQNEEAESGSSCLAAQVNTRPLLRFAEQVQRFPVPLRREEFRTGIVEMEKIIN
jgi:hypothetical protein